MLIVPLKRIPSLLTRNILASPYNLLVSEFVEYLSASELSCVLFYSLNASPPMSPTQWNILFPPLHLPYPRQLVPPSLCASVAIDFTSTLVLFLKINLFCLCWVFFSMRWLSLAVARGAILELWWVGFSLQWFLLLQSMSFRVHGLSCPQHVGSSWIRDWTCVAFIGRWILNHWTMKELLPWCSFVYKHAFGLSPTLGSDPWHITDAQWIWMIIMGNSLGKMGSI